MRWASCLAYSSGPEYTNLQTTVDREAVGVSIVSLAELRYGAACSQRPEANQQAIDAFISAIVVVGVDAAIVRTFGDMKAGLRMQGTLIEDFDLLIAATAQTHGFILVTNKLEHYRRISRAAP